MAVRRLAPLQRSHRPYAIEVNMQELLSIDLGSATDAPPGMGRVRKVSVSLPENLIATLHQRLGKGELKSGPLQPRRLGDLAGEAGPIGVLAALGHRRGQPLVDQGGQRHRDQPLSRRLQDQPVVLADQ